MAPLVLSIRYQCERILIFDDTNSCTPCHFNAIPTNCYIPDWRILLKRPQEGLELLDALMASLVVVFKEQFWSRQAWRAKMLHPSTHSCSFEEVAHYANAGMNYPPSQFQLHLQYQMPPYIPFYYQMHRQGNFFSFGRWYPFQYIRAVLAAAVATGDRRFEAVGDETQIVDIVAHFEELGVSYERMFKECMQRVDQAQICLANWQAADFRMRVGKAGVLVDCNSAVAKDGDTQAVVSADRSAVCNWGKRGGSAGNQAHTGVYYSHAKAERIPAW
jgi:hypothetical protein